MKERTKKLLACAGTVGVMTIMTTIPAMAATIDWNDKAAADVNTYANIRKSADINSERVGMLPAGAVVSVVGEENGWIQVESGEISVRTCWCQGKRHSSFLNLYTETANW